MKAKKLDDVLVYKKSLLGADAVSATLERPAFRTDFKLKDQLSQSSRTVALIAEGFGRSLIATQQATTPMHAVRRWKQSATFTSRADVTTSPMRSDQPSQRCTTRSENVDELDQLPGRVRLEKAQLKSFLHARAPRPIASRLLPSACRP
jgi:hypothetical protein